MSNVDLGSVRGHVEILRYVKAQQAKMKEIEKYARAEVETAMGGADVGLLDGEPAVHWTHYKESRLDGAALKEDHPELVEQYRSINEKRRFEVI